MRLAKISCTASFGSRARSIRLAHEYDERRLDCCGTIRSEHFSQASGSEVSRSPTNFRVAIRAGRSSDASRFRAAVRGGAKLAAPQTAKALALLKIRLQKRPARYECILEARLPRSHCPEHGVWSVAVLGRAAFALLVKAFVMLLCCEMPMAAVADALGEHDTRLWRVAAHYVEATYAMNSWAEVRTISVDETNAGQGHRYVINVLDAHTHKLLLMVEGRSAEALETFAQVAWNSNFGEASPQ